MKENPKPPSSMHHVAHVVGRAALATTGASFVGAITTAEQGGPMHMVFAVGAVGSLLTMAGALVVNGSYRSRSRCDGDQAGQVLSGAVPVPPRAAVAFAVPVAVPVAVLVPDTAGPVAPELAGSATAQARQVV